MKEVRFSAAVFVGRFQPFHAAHLVLLRQALGIAQRCVVVLGSSFQARTLRAPFSWEERAAMIAACLPPEERARVSFLPVRDYHDERRWFAAVERGVRDLLGEALGPVAVVGCIKDETREYLRRFPSWAPVLCDLIPGVRAQELRDLLFSELCGRPERVRAALEGGVPEAVARFLEEWCRQPGASYLEQEWRTLQRYRQEWAGSPFPPVFVTVDVVLRCAGQVLLVQRRHSLGKGLWAVPGGFLEQRETLYQCAVRELREETGIDVPEEELRSRLRGTEVFADPDRSSRGRAITHAHYFDLGDDRDLPDVRAGDDAAAAQWMPVDRLMALEGSFHDDHFQILDSFLGLSDMA